jgi:hypothetical protein
MLNKATRTIIETVTTVSANNNRLKQIKFCNAKFKLVHFHGFHKKNKS